MRYIGTLTSDARGKLGGVVLSRAVTGTVMKAHGVPIQPRSPYQQAQRQAIAYALAFWQSMTSAQRTSWDALASQYTYLNSLAQSYIPTGLQLWTQAWSNSVGTGSTPTATAPISPPTVNAITSVTATFSGGVITFEAFTTGSPYSGAWKLSSSSVINPTINYVKGIRRRPMGYAIGSASIIATTAFTDAYGSGIYIGASLAVRVVPFAETYYISGTPALYTVTVS